MRLMDHMTDPNTQQYDGPCRIRHVPFEGGDVFRRRGGKAVDKHHFYRSAVAASSNLAGFAVVDEIGVVGGQIETVALGEMLPVDMHPERTQLFPTTGRLAIPADVGKDCDLYVDTNGIQYANLDAHATNVLRISDIVTWDMAWVSCGIPPALRYGNL